MTKVIALSIAHNPTAAGADYHGFNEHNESVVWTWLVKSHLEELGYSVVIAPVGGLKQKVAYINKMVACVAIEIHFNGSSNPRVNGCETLYCPGSTNGKRFADTVQTAYAIFMGNKNRGIKEGWYKMEVGGVADYFLRKTKCPALILEPEFISQIHNITSKRFIASNKIADGIAEYVEELYG
ncbi:MAG: hypothetical protein DRR06_12855 [Gammaproteobacteria bacterium]|nr:MAG: hypothetical protein DRR06_12855 [Gammaproteobacteria bacterium]